MYVLYKVVEQVSLPVEQYRQGLSKSTKAKIFQKYLFKICFKGICLKINRIEILDNVILRKEAEILLTLELDLIILKLNQDEYFEGKVFEVSEKGIVVKFLNGILEGTILPHFLHEKSIFVCDTKLKQKTDVKEEHEKSQKEQKVATKIEGKWIMPYSEKQAFTWQIGEKVRFKIQTTNWEKSGQMRFADIIYLRADQEGLGPVSWWV